MYDGFPLKRADRDTRGDDYQFVIQSLDAALRHVFGFPTGVSLPPVFSINAAGNVEILQSFSIGSEVAITEILDEIPVFATDLDDQYLATVAGIRNFTSDFIDVYLQTQGIFVLREGDTMTGQLVADGGITSDPDLNLENVYFANSPRLPDRTPLVSGGRALIQWDDAVLVGSTAGDLRLAGAGPRPTYRGESIAFISDIEDAVAAPGIDYVPEAGGSFSGLVSFDAGLLLPTAIGLQMEYNAGGSLFTLAYVFDDATGEVEIGAPGGVRFANNVLLDEALQIESGAGWQDVIAEAGNDLTFGASAFNLLFLGAGARPKYNGQDLALLAETGGTYVEGNGITIYEFAAQQFEVSIKSQGMVAEFFPLSDPGYYLRLDPTTGVLGWDDLDLIAGTGMALVTDPLTRAITINIDDEGVNTTQLFPGAVTENKLGDDAVEYTKIKADRGSLAPDTEFSLVYLNGDLEWHKGGAGSLVSTAERDFRQISGNGGAEPEVFFGDGPYTIYRITGSNGSNRSATGQIFIEDELVYSFSIAASQPTEDELPINFPALYAARNWKMKLLTNPDSVFSAVMTVYYDRMSP
jgi:hypothetical protein